MPSAVALPACVSVDPRADHARTQALFQQHTGVAEVDDLSDERRVEAHVHELLEDGLSIDDATGIALLNNKRLQAWFQEVGIARAVVVQSGLLTNPTFSFRVRFPEGGGRSERTAGLAQQIADLWRIPVPKRMAQARLNQVILHLARQAQDLAASVHPSSTRWSRRNGRSN